MSTLPGAGPARLSVPRAFAAPRALTEAEVRALRVIADVLIPAAGSAPGSCPAATDEPDFDACLRRAVDARADAFSSITAVLAAVGGASPADVDAAMRSLHGSEPAVFQALSAVIAGAWLLTPTVRARIGYPGQRRDPARFDEAADQLADGILDPVIDRGPIFTPDGTE